MLSIKQTHRLNTLVTRLMLTSHNTHEYHAKTLEEESANAKAHEKALKQYHAFIAKLQEPRS